jgi:hypothetical protein
MNRRPHIRAVVTEDKVDTEFGTAYRKDHICIGQPETNLVDYLAQQLYDADSDKIMVDHELFAIEEFDKTLKEKFEEDTEIIEKIKTIALHEEIVEIEVMA